MVRKTDCIQAQPLKSGTKEGTLVEGQGMVIILARRNLLNKGSGSGLCFPLVPIRTYASCLIQMVTEKDYLVWLEMHINVTFFLFSVLNWTNKVPLQCSILS